MSVELNEFAPIFPVRDLDRALAHYHSLGFNVSADDEGADYGFADRDGVGLHLSVVPDLDPTRNSAAAYLYVDDADELCAEWSAPGIAGETRVPVNTDYGMREGAHLDPDNNLIRFASPLDND